jgi:Pyruvate/2-oxoacid:ferredoxin oxidoreductase delta subunit
MAVRDVVQIDQELCDGCGECVPTCAEGAIAIVDGKARLVSEVYCDGLGACLGHCPQGAITVVRREADAFDEEAVRRHLAESLPSPARRETVGLPMAGHQPGASCPGSRAMAWQSRPAGGDDVSEVDSRLQQWPIQLHLVPPTAPFFADAHVLLAADCVAYAVGGFHRRFLDGRALAIACPKLDSHQEIYLDKLSTIIDHGGIRGLEVMVMEVPCCGGLVRLAQQAVARSSRRVPVTVSVIGIRGDRIAERML